MKMRFYHCGVCGKVIAILSDTGVPTYCCGQPMKELVANKTDGSAEKHVPVYRIEGNTVNVSVGSIPHPMTDVHSITRIGISTGNGFQFRELKPKESPEACFAVNDGDCVEAVYAFCNIHGLWCSETEKKV